MAKTPATDGHAQAAVDQQPAKIVALAGNQRGQGSCANARGPDHGLGFNVFAVGERDAGLIERGDADTEPGLHAELAQRILDDRARTFAHIGSDRIVAIDNDDTRLRIFAEDRAKPRGHLRRRLDAGEAAAGNDDRVAPVHCRPVGQAMQMPVKGLRIVEIVDTEAMRGKARNIRAEQPAAGGHDQRVVGERFARPLFRDDFHRARLGVDRICTALHVDNVDCFKDIQQRRGEGFGFRFVEPRANHQRRLRSNQRDLEAPRERRP